MNPAVTKPQAGGYKVFSWLERERRGSDPSWDALGYPDRERLQ